MRLPAAVTVALALLLALVAPRLLRAQTDALSESGTPAPDSETPASDSGSPAPDSESSVSESGSSSTTAGAMSAADVVSRTLDNGLEVIVWPDHDIPNVAMYNWVRVGSRNEQVGRTGLAHFFEHMMFNGSKNYEPGEFDRVMEANGGSNNAYTTEDVTVYQDWFPRSALDLIFDLEADRIGALAIDPEMVASEREVVLSERRSRVDDDDLGFLWEHVNAAAFLAHPYQNSVLGWPSDIEAWTQADLESFFETYYAPNNATLVVVGDVEPAEVFGQAERKLGPIPRQPPGLDVRTLEPPQTGERRIVVERAAQAPYLVAAFHTGKPGDADWEALGMLVTILTQGDSSRLHRRLVEETSAVLEVGGWVDDGFDPKLTWFWLSLPPDGDAAAVEAMLWEELARIGTDGVTEAELAKAKRLRRAEYWRNLKTISGKAEALGHYAIKEGDYRRLFDAPARDAAVTADQIRDVAARVFAPSNRTVGTLRPVEEVEAMDESVDAGEEVQP